MTGEKTNLLEMAKNNFQQPDSLSKKVVRGGMWVFALRFTNRGLGLVRTVILARLLAPEDFGLLGIAMLAITTLETFSQTGFQAALIQKKENVNSYLDTAWTVSAVRSVLLFVILFFSAPLVATFFNSPQATLVIKVIAVSTLLSGFRNIGILFFQKELEFNKQFTYEFSAALTDLAISISLAFILRNVWALVWGGLAGHFIRFIMSYLLHPYHPRIRFEKEKFKDLFGFGRWILGSSILGFLIVQGDDIFVGKMLGVTALGLYQMAYLISNLPATEITHVISQVTFPVYSKFQDDIQRLREAYLDVLKLTAFVSIPMAGGIFILAPEFTQIFLGTKWLPMVPAMQILVLAGLVRSIVATTGPVFVAVGKPKIETRWQIVRFSVLIVLIYPFTIKWGMLGMSIVVLLSIFISSIGFSFMIIRVIRCGFKDFSKLIVLPLANGIIMVSAIVALKSYISTVGISIFFLLVAVCILIYFGITYLFDKYSNYRIQLLLRESFGSLRGG